MSDVGAILVTGAAGFIGSHVSEALVARGDTVIGLDNFDPYYDPTLKRDNLAELELSDGFELRFIFGSSSSVYGAANEVPFSEDQRVDRPVSPYAASKVAAEAFCHTYHHLYAIPMVCLRFFTVYGPRQRPDLAINKFVRLLLVGEPIPQFGDGSSSRDYTYIEDIVRGVLAAYDSDLQYEIINLGSSSPIRLDEMIAAVAEAVRVEPEIEQLPEQPGDVPRTYANVDKAKELLGWEPEWTLAQGLREFVAWYKERTA